MPHDFDKAYKKGFLGLIAFIILAVLAVLAYMYLPQHNNLKEQLVSAKGNKVYTVKRPVESGMSLSTGEKAIDSETGGSFKFVSYKTKVKHVNKELAHAKIEISEKQAQIRSLQIEIRKIKKHSHKAMKKRAEYNGKIKSLQSEISKEKKTIKDVKASLSTLKKDLGDTIPDDVVYTGNSAYPASVGKKSLTITFNQPTDYPNSEQQTPYKDWPKFRESFKVTKDTTNNIYMKRTSKNGQPNFERHIRLIRITHHNFL